MNSIGNFTAWDKDWNDLINKPTVFGNTTDEIFDAVNNGTFLKTETDPIWIADKSDYFTSAEILGFSYYNLSDFNIGDYSTTTQANNLYASIGYGDGWNKTYADTLYTNETDTDTHLTEDNVEEYIFDADNTANLQMTTYNITMGDAILYVNSTCFVVKIDTTYFEVCK